MSDARHVIVLIADHFEPASAALVNEWCDGYKAAAAVLHDADGRPPRHTWFYDGDNPAVLDRLATAARKGLGEVELHLHHGHDTSDSLRDLLEARKERYAEHGALVTINDPPRRVYGFVHGKWSLDNSRGDQFCGVNNELRILAQTGCYADFTFPAWGRMQPRRRNAIYYAADDPQRPKSYDDGRPVTVGCEPWGDLMIFEGPGRVSGVPDSLACWRPLRWPLERLLAPPALTAHLRVADWKTERWLRARVGVVGRPEWVFVKLHQHGARSGDMRAFLDGELAAVARSLERVCRKCGAALHYATAREAYNMVRAAEAGERGDPNAYRDYVIKPYRNTQ